MNKLIVICVDDERDILTSIDYDLNVLDPCIDIELCESGEEALEILETLFKENELIALIITDHMMPGLKGADLLSKLKQCKGAEHTKVILLTGQATHQDTIKAINTHRLNFYINKPWPKEELIHQVKELLTDYVIERELDPKPYMKYLNTQKLLLRMAQTVNYD